MLAIGRNRIMTMRVALCATILASPLCAYQNAAAFQLHPPLLLVAKAPSKARRRPVIHAEEQTDRIGSKENDQDGQIPEADRRLSDLLPPTVNFSRDSVLFSEDPSTQRNNPLLKFWRGIKATVPPIITGAWPWRDPYLADEDPISAFYNICFVRLPVIAMGCVYTKNLVTGHPLILDYGEGPFEMNPFVVYGVLAAVLA